jgi:hypothetical protein
MERGQDMRWVEHLARIMKKIGPDGAAAAQQGTSATTSTLRRDGSHSP